MSAISQEIDRIVFAVREQAQRGGYPARSAAKDALREMDIRVMRFMAEYYIVDRIEKLDRSVALATERAAAAPTQMHETLVGVGGNSNTAPRPTLHRDWEQMQEALRQRMWDGMQRAVDVYTAEMRMQWTEELLNTSFALADGTTVLWGDATVEQHTQRKQMFLGNAHANLEGAARHQQAITDLEASSADTLRDLVASLA